MHQSMFNNLTEPESVLRGCLFLTVLLLVAAFVLGVVVAKGCC
jgi:hypothetical protein